MLANAKYIITMFSNYYISSPSGVFGVHSIPVFVSLRYAQAHSTLTDCEVWLQSAWLQSGLTLEDLFAWSSMIHELYVDVLVVASIKVINCIHICVRELYFIHTVVATTSSSDKANSGTAHRDMLINVTVYMSDKL